MARPLFVLVAALAMLMAVTVLAQSRLSIIPLSEIHPGMHGYGLSVFQGTEPERFDVDVIDVLHDFQPNMDLILVRTPHPILDRASSVAGMSGSPIYFDGRLAGAYAYGWPFGLDPIAGITPIQNMMAELNRPVRPTSFFGAGALAGFTPVQVNPGRSRSGSPQRQQATTGMRHNYLGGTTAAFDPLHAQAESLGLLAQSPAGLKPTATPIMLGGFDESVTRMLTEHLAPFGLVPLQAGGSADTSSTSGHPQFIDGGSLAVQLIRGDVSATAVGTVTHVEGRRLVAFGHPMMNAGESGFPTATARVLHILVSRSRSFKIAEALEPLGTLIHDRPSAIVVDTQLPAPVIPVTVQLHGFTGAPRTEWHFEVASHRSLAPVLVFAGLTNAIQAAASDATDVIYSIDAKVTIAGEGTIEVTDDGYMRSGPGDAQALGSLRLFSLMEAAYGNPFREAAITSIELDFRARFTRDVLEIIDASVPAPEVDPGSTVPVRVVVQRFDHSQEVRTFPVRIPMAAAGESIDILIQPGNLASLEHPTPNSLSDILHTIQTQLPSTSWTASVQMPSRGLQFRGHVVSSLPASALDTLQLATDSARIRPLVTESRDTLDVGQVSSGFARIRVQVRDTPERQ